MHWNVSLDLQQLDRWLNGWIWGRDHLVNFLAFLKLTSFQGMKSPKLLTWFLSSLGLLVNRSNVRIYSKPLSWAHASLMTSWRSVNAHMRMRTKQAATEAPLFFKDSSCIFEVSLMDYTPAKSRIIFEEKSVEDVCQWLESKNVKVGILESFKGKTAKYATFNNYIYKIFFRKCRFVS